MPADLVKDKTDNKILLTAYALQKAGKQVFFVSKDINARVKATALGIKAVDYEKQKVNINELYPGYCELDGSKEMLHKLKKEKTIKWNDRLVPNQFVILNEKQNNESELTRYNRATESLDYIGFKLRAVSGIKPRNLMQRMALDLLLDDSPAQITSATEVLKAKVQHNIFGRWT